MTAISYSIRADHSHEVAASPCQQSLPDHHTIIFAAFQRIESRTCFTQPKVLNRVRIRANLPRIRIQTKSKESSAFLEGNETIRICTSHEHVLFLQKRLEPFGTVAVCCNRKTKECNSGRFSTAPPSIGRFGSVSGRSPFKPGMIREIIARDDDYILKP
jgi:hypothetical protein